MGLLSSKGARPISDEAFNSIINKLEQSYFISNAVKTKLRCILLETTYQKDCQILNDGAKQPVAWFLIDGLLQEITVDKVTLERKTTWFWFDCSFVYASPGFFDREPSQITINVAKTCRVVLMSYENWKSLKDTFEEFDKLTEMLRSDYETSRKLHLNDINTLGTPDRYLKFEAKINKLCQHIQLRHVAEYTGMATDTLGKLRRKFVKEIQAKV